MIGVVWITLIITLLKKVVLLPKEKREMFFIQEGEGRKASDGSLRGQGGREAGSGSLKICHLWVRCVISASDMLSLGLRPQLTKSGFFIHTNRGSVTYSTQSCDNMVAPHSTNKEE